MESPKISVIVPVYNVEKHLHRCIESILAQTFTDFELILVDDGSSDSSPSICNDYANRNARIKAIHLANGGVGNARNKGLCITRGEYVCFVDSDDYVSPIYLENLMSHMEDCDLVISSAIYEGLGGKKYAPNYFESFEGKKLCLLVENNIVTRKTFPWAKLYKKSIIDKNNISFPINMPIGEDAVFLFSYVACCNKVKVVSDCDYFYQVAMVDSLTKKRYPVQKEMEILEKIYTSTHDLMETLHVKSPKGISNIKRLRQNYVRRVLDSIYFVEKLPHKQRLEMISNLPQKELTSMPVTSSLRAKVLAILLNLHLFRLYDFTRSFVAKSRV